MVSHEFRTPISTVIMLVDIIKQKFEDTVGLYYLNLIKAALSLLLSLVNDMIDLKCIKENRFAQNL